MRRSESPCNPVQEAVLCPRVSVAAATSLGCASSSRDHRQRMNRSGPDKGLKAHKAFLLWLFSTNRGNIWTRQRHREDERCQDTQTSHRPKKTATGETWNQWMWVFMGSSLCAGPDRLFFTSDIKCVKSDYSVCKRTCSHCVRFNQLLFLLIKHPLAHSLISNLYFSCWEADDFWKRENITEWYMLSIDL